MGDHDIDESKWNEFLAWKARMKSAAGNGGHAGNACPEMRGHGASFCPYTINHSVSRAPAQCITTYGNKNSSLSGD